MKTLIRTLAGLLLIAGAMPLATAAEGETTETRVSESRYYAKDGREQSVPDRVSTEEREKAPTLNKSEALTRGQQQAATRASAANTDFWFFTADIELFADDDRDGYYHGIDLLFDADTIYTRAEVYAVVYLSFEGGPWEEYAVTEDFAIWGTSGTDEYVIVTELLAGYPRGSYDVLIELFDAFDSTFLADIGPNNTSELAFLPLEDAERDLPAIAPTPVVVNRGGGGSADWLMLAMLGLIAVSAGAFRRRHRQPAAARTRRVRCA